MTAQPWIIRQRAAILPPGYRLMQQDGVYQVQRTTTGAWVARGKSYTSQREAILAAMRSARMVRYHQMCRAAA